MPSPADCTTSAVLVLWEYEGPSASILLKSFSRRASLTRSDDSVPKYAAVRIIRNRTIADTTMTITHCAYDTAAIPFVPDSSRDRLAMPLRHANIVISVPNSRFSSKCTTAITKAMLASNPIHMHTTFAATSLPTPGARENSLLSNMQPLSYNRYITGRSRIRSSQRIPHFRLMEQT